LLRNKLRRRRKMPTINGVEYKVQRASPSQEALIKKWEGNKEKIKALAEESDLILKTLVTEIKDKAIVVPVFDKITEMFKEFRTYFLSDCVGRYVTFSKYDFIHNAKTTKKDEGLLDLVKEEVDEDDHEEKIEIK
jgi:hypothetical protein